MPELPEVETVRSGLAPYVEGRRIVKMTLHRANLRALIPQDLPERITGKKVRALARHGKTLIWKVANGPDFVWHLGMSGSFRTSADAPVLKKHDHVVLEMEGGTYIVFNDPRRFGHLGYAPEDFPGLDPLNAELTPGTLGILLAGRNTPIKSALLDQSLITGLGNIYVCEALFQARVHPARPARSLTKKENAALTKSIHDVLARAIASGGSSLRDHVMVDGEAGKFQHDFKVYGRRGKKCVRCATPVEALRQAGRSTFFCPQCQPAKSLA